MPGVPDFYQGSEDWTFNLTDPDNRRPVDFARAAERLTRSFESNAAERRDLKRQVAVTLLQFRADHGPMLREAAYRPLRVRGSRSGSVVAFERKGAHSRLVVVVPRLTARPAQWPLDDSFWGNTEVRLPASDGRWTSLLASDDVVLERPWSRIGELDPGRPWVVLYRSRIRPGRNRSL
jgi:(1->4)-alpha-D-glucan 1-alpha-D-glucosylmutase